MNEMLLKVARWTGREHVPGMRNHLGISRERLRCHRDQRRPNGGSVSASEACSVENGAHRKAQLIVRFRSTRQVLLIFKRLRLTRCAVSTYLRLILPGTRSSQSSSLPLQSTTTTVSVRKHCVSIRSFGRDCWKSFAFSNTSPINFPSGTSSLAEERIKSGG